jgi:tRNA (cmo5U34)-methyltransferase
MNNSLAAFSNRANVSSYTRDTPRKVPGLSDLHRMTTILLRERASKDAHLLVVGAGGGLELKAMAETQRDWRFTGIDPSPAMLDIARQTTAPHASRIALLEGTVDHAPLEPFDGATCLLTLHFLGREERLHMLTEIRRRLKPGSGLVVAHHTAIGDQPVVWLERSVRFAEQTDAPAQSAAGSAKIMAERLSLLSPVEEEALLLEAGFARPALFYAALSFRGWVATTL